jgi:Fur family peroxide stress response transcriptional regulator
MPVPRSEIERRVEVLSRALREQGMRLTHQRLEIVREIAATDEHPNADTVFRRVRTRVPTVSLDTVYRTLGTLVDLGLVRQVTATPGPVRYDANTAPHQHFVCTRCGAVHDVDDSGLDTARAIGTTTMFGTVETVEVQLRGVCSGCAQLG